MSISNNYHNNILKEQIIFLILIFLWFPILFSNYLPGKTEIFPFGLFTIFFLNIKNATRIFFFSFFCFIYTLFVNLKSEVLEFLSSYIPFLNIFLIYFFCKNIDFKLNFKIFQNSIKIIICFTYLMFFMELLNLDRFFFVFNPLRIDEPGGLSLSYINRFNFFESEPSRASLFLFILGVISQSLFKKNNFLIINFILDIIFVRSLVGYALWFLFFLFYNKKYIIFFIFLFVLSIFFSLNTRFDYLISKIFQNPTYILEEISILSGHRLPSVMLTAELFMENILGYGFVDTKIYLKNLYLLNIQRYDFFLEETQIRVAFKDGLFSLDGIFLNLIFSLGILGFLFIIFIIKKIFFNFKKKNKLTQSAIIAIIIICFFAVGKGVVYPWILFGLIHNKTVTKYFSS
jgi:hypothetical protein